MRWLLAADGTILDPGAVSRAVPGLYRTPRLRRSPSWAERGDRADRAYIRTFSGGKNAAWRAWDGNGSDGIGAGSKDAPAREFSSRNRRPAIPAHTVTGMAGDRCKAGDLVEVRSRDEILSTLDDQGCLDALPFMPEMLQYCGQRLRVYKAAHKTCDSTFYRDGRYMKNAVFLEDLRCDGTGHASCEAECSLFFKLAWLKPVEPMRNWATPAVAAVGGRDEQWLRTTTETTRPDGQTLYRCQATQHLAATRPIKRYDWALFWEDLRCSNWSLAHMGRTLLLLAVFDLRRLGVGWRAWDWLYRVLHRAFYGTMDPHIQGVIPGGSPTPLVTLDLVPGEMVRVRALDEIRATLNQRNRNRGLAFNPEMAPFSGGTYRVKRRVTRIVDERNGKLLEIKGSCIMLEGGHCTARYHPEAPLCPRRIPQYFREAWLERVSDRR